MADLVWVSWYATVFRKDMFAEEVGADRPPTRCATARSQYQVHVSNDDRYRITQMTWILQERLVSVLGRGRR